jgi:hypothetical protein
MSLDIKDVEFHDSSLVSVGVIDDEVVLNVDDVFLGTDVETQYNIDISLEGVKNISIDGRAVSHIVNEGDFADIVSIDAVKGEMKIFLEWYKFTPNSSFLCEYIIRYQEMKIKIRSLL